jgi:hypothetical protein
MKSCILVIAVASGLFVATASAGVPNGNGLERLEAPIPLVCTADDGTSEATYTVALVRGAGATGWRVDQNQHHVLSFFSITTYLASGPVTESKTWGNHNGLAALHCSQFVPSFGEFPAVLIEGTIHPTGN